MTDQSQEERFDTLLSFICIGRGKTTAPVNVSVTPVPSTVADLKLAIQDKFQIPKCLQSISIDSGKTALPDSQLLKELYVRSGDCFTVTYLDTAQVESIRNFNTQWLGLFLGKLTEIRDNKDKLQHFLSTDHHTAHRYYHSVMYDVLTPWKGLSTVEASRQFMIQEGVIDRTIQLYSLVLDLNTSVGDKQELLDLLEVNCLGLLWNFAETRSARLYVVNRGGFELMIRSTESCLGPKPYEKLDYHLIPAFQMYGLFDHCVGCISNYSEIEPCQVPLASNSAVMELILLFSINGPQLNIFTKVLIANCIFRLSHNTLTHKYLLEPRALEKILASFSKILASFSKIQRNATHRTSMVICYALVVALTRLLAFSLDLVPKDRVGDVVSAVKTFLSTIKTDKVTLSLDEHDCNWVTMAPMVDIFFAPIFHQNQKLNLDLELDVGEIRSVCMQSSAMSLTVEMNRPCHRTLAVKQGLLHCLVCLPWIVGEAVRDDVQRVAQLFKKETDHLPVPTLHSLAIMSLARTGQGSVRRIFTFC